MVVLGVPMAAPLAVLAFLCGYIPYFGGIISTSPHPAGRPTRALGAGPFVVLLVLMVVRGAIMSYVVRPDVYGRTVNIHPAVVLLALPAGYQLAGAVGLFAAVPVTAVVIAVAGAAVGIVEPGQRRRCPAWSRPGSTGWPSSAGARSSSSGSWRSW